MKAKLETMAAKAVSDPFYGIAFLAGWHYLHSADDESRRASMEAIKVLADRFLSGEVSE